MAVTDVSNDESRQSGQHPAAEQGAIWRDAAWLLVSGADAVDFLQGYLTSDAQRINSDIATPMALCSVKGRVLASGWAVATQNGVALLVHASLAERIAAFLKPFITFSKCSLVHPPGSLHIHADGDFELINGIRVSFFLDTIPDTIPDTTAILDTPIDASASVSEALIAAQFAFVSHPVSERFLPQMLGLDAVGAVDFDKGCYLGQEIVARAQHRGEVKRRLTAFTFDGPAPAPGSTYQHLDCIIATANNGQGLAVSRT